MRRRGAAAVLLALLSGCTSPSTTDEPYVPVAMPPCPEQDGAPAVSPAPPAVALDCLGGGRLDLRTAPGVPTVVNLWATWCGPCREELPIVGDLADRVGDRVRVVGVVHVDRPQYADEFSAEAGVHLPGALDPDGEVLRDLALPGPPITLFIRADGSLAHVQVVPVRDATELDELVRQHLGVTV